jgi:hypothetical protein
MTFTGQGVSSGTVDEVSVEFVGDVSTATDADWPSATQAALAKEKEQRPAGTTLLNHRGFKSTRIPTQIATQFILIADW